MKKHDDTDVWGNPQMIKYYRFADITIEIHMPEELPVPENMGRFEICWLDSMSEDEASSSESEGASSSVDGIYYISFIDSPSQLTELQSRWQDAVRYERDGILILTRGDLECRWLSFRGADVPYAICEEISPVVTMIYIMRDQHTMFSYDTIFASLFSFERRMLRRGGLLLHCAYMCLDGQAVLFSAPSGTGKSTQAELWGTYRGTRQINGDASLLMKRDGRWTANGWSVCGSSEICYNETYPIQAIVMLYQSKTNTCRQLTPAQAFKKIYPQIKVNSWNSQAQAQVFSLMDDLIGSIPVLELGCDISENAVECLEETLEEID